jgi:glucose-6-phosphate 1-dehydrogenase
VPIFVKTGKCLAHKKTEIRVIFKQVGECFVQAPDAAQGAACANNVFTFRIQPDEGIALQINAREPQDCRDELCRISRYGLTPVLLDFCHSCKFGPYAPEAYEILLQSIMAGDTEIGVSAEEIEAQWAVVEQVQALKLPLYPYKKGSAGPVELEQLWKQ